MRKFTKKEFIQEVIDHLRELGDGVTRPIDSEDGICGELLDMFELHDIPFSDALRGWRHFSGSQRFPIDWSYLDRIMWDEGAEYGSRRLDACHLLADWFEDHIDDLCAWPVWVRWDAGRNQGCNSSRYPYD